MTSSVLTSRVLTNGCTLSPKQQSQRQPLPPLPRWKALAGEEVKVKVSRCKVSGCWIASISRGRWSAYVSPQRPWGLSEPQPWLGGREVLLFPRPQGVCLGAVSVTSTGSICIFHTFTLKVCTGRS